MRRYDTGVRKSIAPPEDTDHFSLWTRPLNKKEHAMAVLPQGWQPFRAIRSRIRKASGLDDRSIGRYFQAWLRDGVLESRLLEKPVGPHANFVNREFRLTPMPVRPVVNPAVIRMERNAALRDEAVGA